MDSPNPQAALIDVTFFSVAASRSGECLHYDAPLPWSLAVLVGLFGIIACDVVQAMFDNLRRSEDARLTFKIPACLRPRPTPLLAEILQRDLDALVVHALELSLEPFPTLGAA